MLSFIVLVDCNLLLRDELCVILAFQEVLYLKNIDSFVLVDIIDQV